MRMVFGVIAEYSGLLAQGTLVVVGIFDGFGVAVASENMPVLLRHHNVVVRTAFSPSEFQAEFVSHLRLIDEDGRELLKLGPFQQRMKHAGYIPGFEATHDWHSHFTDLTVPRCGTYTWEVLINEQKIGEIPFHVTRGKPQPVHQTITAQPG